MNTLLVIDMQNAWFDEAPRFDKPGVIERINQAAACVRRDGGRVVYIRHCDGDAVPGSRAWQVIPELEVDAADRHVDKLACDSFAGTELLEQLAGSETLYICGLATEFCVDTTLRAALSQGFDVVALSDAHTTGDRPHLSARHVIEHHNWIWTHLAVPAGRRLAVQTVQDAVGRAERRRDDFRASP